MLNKKGRPRLYTPEEAKARKKAAARLDRVNYRNVTLPVATVASLEILAGRFSARSADFTGVRTHISIPKMVAVLVKMFEEKYPVD